MTVEQLEKQVELLKKVILALGKLLAEHVPSVRKDLTCLGVEWADAEDNLGKEQTTWRN